MCLGVITNFVFACKYQPKMAKHIQFEQFAHIYPERWSCYLVVASKGNVVAVTAN